MSRNDSMSRNDLNGEGSRYDRPDRRRVLVAGSALVGAAVLPGAAGAAEGLASAAELTARTRAFLAGLDSDKRKAASFEWDGKEWRGWNYFGFPTVTKPGLRLEQMDAAQKDLAWALLATLMSPEGLKKARNVMTLQDVLMEFGDGVGQRSSERFSFAVYGAPSDTGVWGFRLEGHHLHQSIAVRDGQIVSVSPSSFSCNPNRISSGRHAGLVTLQAEEALARRLIGDLGPRLQGRARLSNTPIDNILSYAGRERANGRKVGLPASELSSAQRDLLWQLIETYAVEHLSSPLATAQKARVRTGDREAVHFAWYGPNTPERAFGYRVIGDGFVIELGSVDPAALHLHTIYHDLSNVLGRQA
jgi:Protein of unknown function (DUF3500)